MIYFIPARKRSIRAKGKNTRMFMGRPLIEWTFMQVKEVIKKYPGEVVVSTDDEGIWGLAGEYGFEILDRPHNLCTAKAKMSDVLFYHTEEFKKHKEVVVLFPTSPLRSSEAIKDAIARWKSIGSDDQTLMGVSEVNSRPYGLMKKGDKGYLECMSKLGDRYYQSQNIPSLYRANSFIYIIPTKIINRRGINSQLFCSKSIPFVAPFPQGFEIDEEIDFKIAETLFEQYPLPRVYKPVPKNITFTQPVDGFQFSLVGGSK